MFNCVSSHPHWRTNLGGGRRSSGYRRDPLPSGLNRKESFDAFNYILMFALEESLDVDSNRPAVDLEWAHSFPGFHRYHVQVMYLFLKPFYGKKTKTSRLRTEPQPLQVKATAARPANASLLLAWIACGIQTTIGKTTARSDSEVSRLESRDAAPGTLTVHTFIFMYASILVSVHENWRVQVGRIGMRIGARDFFSCTGQIFFILHSASRTEDCKGARGERCLRHRLKKDFWSKPADN
ncbi:unnamed protein product [Nesidiocoris tenuis]|uniref:Uncharacterized protein n=1 Tax=Nesidiocoris tenuis TaxID=355587 RepID=A0A6H5HTB7_9HEMI|nr:unnamed protein product [Nesidiocoris tenuis]